MKRSDFNIPLAQRLLLLLCIFLVCYVITAVLAYLLGRIMTGRPEAALRISTMLQDLLVFIVPAIATAVVSCRKPDKLLLINRFSGIWTLPLVALVMLVSIPAQEWLIHWNENISLPEALSSIEDMMRTFEANASETMMLLLSDTSVGALIVNILIIGVAAGFSEELFFRGSIQRLLCTGGINPHTAIWATAFVFSALHMQFFGFFPRLLLGAYFGYLLYWTGSIWVPVFAHILNNTIYVITAWMYLRLHPGSAIENGSLQWGVIMIALSSVLTAATLFLIRYYSKRKSSASADTGKALR